jgi:Gamma-glutamyl cyclotransferase, AIG2-like
MECIDISGAKAKGPQNYIFGYGSLIEDESRRRTTPSAVDAWPARVQGIRRGWWARGAKSGLTTTYLGALPDPGSKVTCNGVIYKVSAEELAATDRRESAGYQRCRIETADIKMLDGRSTPPEGVVWAYLNLLRPDQIPDNLATPQFPIVQSYVDICVHGCLEVESKYPTAPGFTQEFIATTDKWSSYWVNDRLYPRRPFIFQPAAQDIDDALKSAPKTAELFYEVEIEPASWEDRKPVRPK